jgi:eukaryotic-like serine/threonine-protein kinase
MFFKEGHSSKRNTRGSAPSLNPPARSPLAYKAVLSSFQMVQPKTQREPSASPPSDLIGKEVGRFSIRARLGVGGMGEVYLAEDTGLKRQVALKRIAPRLCTDPMSRHRLWKEAEWASRLNDPHIAAVYDVIEHGGEVFVVMEYVKGETLRRRIARPFMMAEFLSIATQCAEALAAAHRAGLLHRDIKPENIMLTPSGQVKALDFGVARELPGPDRSVTRDTLESASFAGTLVYMAPEILQERQADARADIFSLGVVFYEALTGYNPFHRNGFLKTCNSILHEDPPPLRKQNSKVSEELEHLVGKMLAKDPEERYATSADLAVDLRALARSLHPASDLSRLARSKRIARLAAALLITAMALGLAAANPSIRQRAWTWLGFTQVPRQKQLAVLQFRAENGNPEAASFAAGLTDTLSAKLTQLTDNRSLQVVPTTEIHAKHVATAQQAYAEFGVNLVLEGSLSKSGDLVRVNYALVDARARRQLSANSLTLPASDPFAVQDQVVNGAVQMLGLVVPPDEHRALEFHGTRDPAAYNLYLQARGYLQSYDKPENTDSAIRVFQQALQLDPNFALAYAGLGDAYWRKYQDEKDPRWVQNSRDSCEQALHLDDKLAAAHECLGTLYTGTGRHENAVPEFERALEFEPTNDDAYRGLARAYERLGKLSQAEKTYRQAIDLRPHYWATYSWLGAFYYSRTRYHEAAEMFSKVISLAPDSFRGYYNLGGTNIAEGRYADAIMNLEHSISIRPTPTAYSNLGTAYFYVRRFDDSARSFAQSLKLNDKEYDVWWNLGDAYNWIPGKTAEAAEAYHKCISLANDELKIDSRDTTALGIQAICFAMTNDREAALANLKSATSLSPKDAELCFDAALIYNQFGESEQTLQWLEKAVAAGYSRSMMRDSPIFDGLRPHPRFQKLFQIH